jgi:2-dehydro-3-deoxyphosphooctonate aldolase (KDO 8-P synthase)
MTQPNATVKVGAVEIGNHLKLAIIAGPCALESRAHAMEMSAALKEIADKFKIEPDLQNESFDKANRSRERRARHRARCSRCRFSPRSARRPDCRCSPTCMSASNARVANRRRSADSGVSVPPDRSAAGRRRTGKPVNVKKGQFLAPGT